MIKVDVTKNLIALEDLLVGVGTVGQQRGPTGTAPVQVTKINGSNLPYDETYSMQEKFDALQIQIDTLPPVVDQDGNLLTGLIHTSTLNLNLAGRLWRKTVGTVGQLYYGTELILEYSTTNGNIIIGDDSNYIAADNAIIQAYQLADSNLAASISALSASLGSAAFEDAGNGANQLVKLDSAGRLPAVDGSLLTGLAGGVPVGYICILPFGNPDPGWLEIDGSAVSRTTYAALFAKWGTQFGIGDGATTFNLPDPRGLFLRIFDGGKGVDPGRVLASIQDEDIKAHSHSAGSLNTNSAGAHGHGIAGGKSDGNQSNYIQMGGQIANEPVQTGNTTSAGAHTHTISGSTGSFGGNETRPKNWAIKLVVKAL